MSTTITGPGVTPAAIAFKQADANDPTKATDEVSVPAGDMTRQDGVKHHHAMERFALDLQVQPPLPAPTPNANDSQDSAIATLGGLVSGGGALNMQAIFEVLEKVDQESRKLLKQDRAVQRDAVVNALDAQETDTKEAGEFNFVASMVSSSVAIAGAGLSLAGSVKSTRGMVDEAKPTTALPELEPDDPLPINTGQPGQKVEFGLDVGDDVDPTTGLPELETGDALPVNTSRPVQSSKFGVDGEEEDTRGSGKSASTSVDTGTADTSEPTTQTPAATRLRAKLAELKEKIMERMSEPPPVPKKGPTAESLTAEAKQSLEDAKADPDSGSAENSRIDAKMKMAEAENLRLESHAQANQTQATLAKWNAAGQITTEVGKMAGSVFTYEASRKDADKIGAQADQTKAQAVVDDDTDLIKNYTDTIQQIIQKLSDVQEAQAQANTAIANNAHA